MTVTMIDLKSGMCRWPIGDSKEAELRFCGAPSDPSLSYCEAHMVTALAPQRARKPL